MQLTRKPLNTLLMRHFLMALCFTGLLAFYYAETFLSQAQPKKMDMNSYDDTF